MYYKMNTPNMDQVDLINVVQKYSITKLITI